MPSAAAEAVANYLLEIGSPGIEWRERGDSVVVTAYFRPSDPTAAVEKYLEAIGVRRARVTSRSISDRGWAENWKQHFQPLEVGNFFIRPPWVSEAPPGRIPITVDPGMAFGTGHHETTRACLSLLQRHIQPGSRGLDFGAGSGILAIAMCLLGAPAVVAVDRDPLAREATRANAQRNGVADRVTVRRSLRGARGPFGAIAANVDAPTLRAYSGELASRAAPGALLVLSGICQGQGEAVRAAFGSQWREVDALEAGGWVSLALLRR